MGRLEALTPLLKQWLLVTLTGEMHVSQQLIRLFMGWLTIWINHRYLDKERKLC